MELVEKENFLEQWGSKRKEKSSELFSMAMAPQGEADPSDPRRPPGAGTRVGFLSTAT